MKERDDYIDKIFQEELYHYREEPQHELWAGIAAEIAPQPVGKVISWSGTLSKKALLSILAIGVLSISTMLLLRDSSEPVAEPIEKVEQEFEKQEPALQGESSPNSTIPLVREQEERAEERSAEVKSNQQNPGDEQPRPVIDEESHFEKQTDPTDPPLRKGLNAEVIGTVKNDLLEVHLEVRRIDSIYPPAKSVFLDIRFTEPMALDSSIFQAQDSLKWDWFGAPGILVSPTYRGQSLFRAEFKVGKYLNHNSFIQAGVAIDQRPFSLDVPVSFTRLFGAQRLKLMVQGGALFSFDERSGPFERSGQFRSGLTIGAGALFEYNHKLRIVALPYYSGLHSDVLFQLGIQFKF